MEIRIKIQAKLNTDKSCIFHTTVTQTISQGKYRDNIDHVRNMIYDVSEKVNRRALIELGWTPPKGEGNETT